MMTQSPQRNSPYWAPEALWQGETVFIIGGGPSLQGFDWSPYQERRVLGVNDAYKLGPWVDANLHGDNKWMEAHWQGLLAFPNLKMSVQPMKPMGDPSVKWIQRRPRGLWNNGKVGWNGSTGAAAINVALTMGAKKVVLLGFDMKEGPSGERNWHPNTIDTTPLSHREKPDTKSTLDLFLEGFERIAQELPEKFPKCQVVNAGPDSALNCFDRVFLSRRRVAA